MADFTMTLSSKKSPEEIFQILLNVRSWWSGLFSEEFSGSSERLGDVFTFKAGDGAHFSEQKLEELIPGKKIVWLVTDSELTFLEDKKEWVGSKLIFEVSELEDHTSVKFTHEGLTTDSECYDVCAPVWTKYLQTNLFSLITA